MESQGAPDEETPPLRDGNPRREETPLPLAQILILLLLQLSEPITSQSIKPYINQVRSSIPLTYVVDNVRLSLLVNSQLLVVTKGGRILRRANSMSRLFSTGILTKLADRIGRCPCILPRR